MPQLGARHTASRSRSGPEITSTVDLATSAQKTSNGAGLSSDEAAPPVAVRTGNVGARADARLISVIAEPGSSLPFA